VPVHLARQDPPWVASEVKALRAADCYPASIEMVPPGTVLTITRAGVAAQRWYEPPAAPCADDRPTAAPRVRSLVLAGAEERTVSDVPVCTLLSGGIDSAAVAVALAAHFPHLVAYTAVHDPKSRDLRCAREVAHGLAIELREVPVPAPTAADLRSVVERIELPHKAQVEIGWACLKLAEAMRADGFRVTYSGEGSDELWASYGFAYHALKTQDWHSYRKRLFLDQARKNFVRCNKVFLAHSVECRLPFLHTPLVAYALSLRRDAVQDGTSRPKAVMQDALAADLPPSVVRRPKLAFQDGLGLKAAVARVVADPRRFSDAEYRRFLATS
jgi:asparagine synthase (glutamine-hydrolysing)